MNAVMTIVSRALLIAAACLAFVAPSTAADKVTFLTSWFAQAEPIHARVPDVVAGVGVGGRGLGGQDRCGRVRLRAGACGRDALQL